MTCTTTTASVIICVRNGAATLRDQLDALGTQSDAPDFEVIIVDNGSTDDTVSVAQSWIAAGTGAASSAQLVDGGDRIGICHARNTGARAARGRFLVFCDADDLVAPGWLAAATTTLAAGAAAVTGRVYELDPAGRRAEQIILDEPGRVITDFADVPFAWGCSFAVTARTFADIGGFDESLPPYGCDDIDFGLRLASSGVELAYNPEMAVHYRETTATRALLRRNFRGGVAQACVWQRHPTIYGPLPGTMRQLRALTVDPLRTLLRGERGSRWMSAMSQCAHNTGNLVGVHRWVRSGRLGTSILFETSAGMVPDASDPAFDAGNSDEPR
jgi:glycosyltransferase involved in cell wall biosynthesis